MNASSLMYFLLAIVATVNVVSAVLWLRLLFLVRAADGVLSFATSSLYARYLFGQVMAGKWFRAPTSLVLGNPNRDRVIRKVIGSAQYETVKSVAFFVKDMPLNVLPYLV